MAELSEKEVVQILESGTIRELIEMDEERFGVLICRIAAEHAEKVEGLR